jgi:hypothetical protein
MQKGFFLTKPPIEGFPTKGKRLILDSRVMWRPSSRCVRLCLLARTKRLLDASCCVGNGGFWRPLPLTTPSVGVAADSGPTVCDQKSSGQPKQQSQLCPHDARRQEMGADARRSWPFDRSPKCRWCTSAGGVVCVTFKQLTDRHSGQEKDVATLTRWVENCRAGFLSSPCAPWRFRDLNTGLL